jgi:hypothetical protein
MGQYYRPAILAKNKKTVLTWVESWTFESGSKLMEHSWSKNPFVRAVESLIHQNPYNIVWGGDYADECKSRKTNTYQRCKDSNEVKPETILTDKQTRFVVNHSKKQYVDKTKVTKNSDGWRIAPLPLLTCEGNGLGGGDFHINEKRKQGNTSLIGAWARDLISIEETKPIGYKELNFDLVEG